MDFDNRPQQPAPNASAALVLGIISCFFCLTCYGGFVAVVLGIIGLVLSNKGRKAVRASPESFTNVSMLNAGWIMSIIGTSLGALEVVVMLLALLGVVAGSRFSRF